MSFILNFYTVLVYFIFPFTDFVINNYTHDKPKSSAAHFTLAFVYFIFLFLTFWSYMAARCADPGYVPRDFKSYNTSLFSTLERNLWDLLE